MKKLLAALGVISLTASTSLSVISCTIPQQSVNIFVGKNTEKDHYKGFDGPSKALTVLSSEILNILNFKKEMFPDNAKYEEQLKLRSNKAGKLYSFESLFKNNDEILTGAGKNDFFDEYNDSFDTSFSEVTFESDQNDEAFQNLDLTVIRAIVPDGKTRDQKVKFLRADTATSKDDIKDFDKHKGNTAKILRSSDLPTGINEKMDQMKNINPDSKLKYVPKDEDDKEILKLQKVKDQEVLTPFVRDKDFKDKEGEFTQTIVASNIFYSFDVDPFKFETIFNGHENKYKIETEISGLSGILALTPATHPNTDNADGINMNYYWYLAQYQFNNEDVKTSTSAQSMQGKFDNLSISKINITKL